MYRTSWVVTLMLASLLVGACGDDDSSASQTTFPTRWTVTISAAAPEPVRWAAADVVRYLTEMGRSVELAEDDVVPECEAGQGKLTFLGDGTGVMPVFGAESNDQTWWIGDSRCGPLASPGVSVDLAGGGLLGRQYAAYEWLHALGVRFFHPEEEYVPAEPVWSQQPIVREHTPVFRWRSVTLHLTHPLELGDAFRSCRSEYLPEAKRYIDWQIKNLASAGASGACEELAGYGHRRGFLVSSGFRLWGAQQASSGVIDPDDPRSEEEQLAEAIDERMARQPRPQHFSVNHQVTEFTGMPDDVVVRLLTFIADYFALNYPEVSLINQVHGTHTEPTSVYGVNYNTLGQFAPDNMGLQMHPLMFYDLFRPAPVYGNESFGYLFDLMAENYERRTLWYFPEAAWWLTFDIPVPLYLPITIEARDRDIQGLAFMLDGGLEGHRVFGTGHEWGYWQNEYCPLRMSADLDYRWQDCLADITSPMGEGADEVRGVVEEVVALQQRDFFTADLLAYMVGSDAETRAAATIGIDFHPLPPTPSQIMRWSAEDVSDWLDAIAPGLERMDSEYAALTARLDDVEGRVPNAARSWFREIRDGVEATGLRARHAHQVYGAVVRARQAQLEFDPSLEERALESLEEAKLSTASVVEVIRRREQDYRYLPLDRSIAGGPDGSADENWTIYNYRYLNRTHHAFYYTRVDAQAEEAILGAEPAAAASVDDHLLSPGDPLRLSVHVPSPAGISVDLGDGTTLMLGEDVIAEHTYMQAGRYQIEVSGTTAGNPFQESLVITVFESEYHAPAPAKILLPENAALIEDLIPGVVFGAFSPEEGVIGFDIDGTGRVGRDAWVDVDLRIGAAIFRSEAVDLQVPVVSAGEVLTGIDVTEVSLVLLTPPEVLLSGSLNIDSVVRAIVEVGGFEEDGARKLVADLLEFTPETLPEHVPVSVEWEL